MKDFIKQARIKLGMTQTELAKNLFVRQSAVANWEAGIREPSGLVIHTIKIMLGAEK